MRRYFFPVLMGVVGTGVLLSLGFWQVQRLDWKRGILHEIETQISAPAIALPETPSEAELEYRAVEFRGTPTGRELHVLSSGTSAGTGYRVISAVTTDEGRTIMVDLGVMPLEAKGAAPDLTSTTILGNFLWPDDKTSSTPEPDLAKGIWFARDVAPMAEALEAEPILVVLRQASHYDPRVTPVPVDTSGIKNDHREYAITWFLLAAVWTVMSLWLIIRIARRKE